MLIVAEGVVPASQSGEICVSRGLFPAYTKAELEDSRALCGFKSCPPRKRAITHSKKALTNLASVFVSS